MVDSARNVADLVRSAARRDPEHPALLAVGRSGEDRGRLTWAELDHEVDAIARGLAGLGCTAGDRVVLRLGNTVDFPLAYFAVLRAGLIAVPTNPAYTGRELAHIVADSGAKLILTTPGVPAPTAAPAHPLAADVLTDLPHADGGSVASIGSDQDLAVLMYTSGTSGAPKGAMLPHRALLANLEQCSTLQPPPMSPDDVVALALPLFHIYGLNAALGMIARTGATGVLLERFDVTTSLAGMARHGVTNLPGAPPMYQAWLARGDRRLLDPAMSGLRLATSGAAPLPADVLERMRREFGVTVYEGYGLTETSPVLTSNLVTGRTAPASIGQAIPGVELRLVEEGAGPDGAPDADDPFDDPTEEGTGEIVVRGANLFVGYWPDAAGGPDAAGWFRTGDVAYRDAAGDLHLVDRRRDLILVRGFNVYPREVELVLTSHPRIQEAAVLGVPDPDSGQGVRAIVVVSEGPELTPGEITHYTAGRLAGFKCPTSVQFVEELPHSVTGKVSKARLRELGFADAGAGAGAG